MKIHLVRKSGISLLLLLVLLSNNIFGLLNGINMPNIPLSGLGTLYLSDIVFIILVMQMIFIKIHRAPKFNQLTSINSFCLNSFLLYILLHAFYAFFFDELPANQILNGLRNFAFYFVLYCYLAIVRSETASQKLFLYISIIAVITAIVSYFQTITGTGFTGAKVEQVSQFGIYRTYQIGNQLILLVGLLLFVKLLSTVKQNRRFIQYFVLFFLLGALLTSYSRSLIGLTLVAGAIIWIFSRRPKVPGNLLLLVSPAILILMIGCAVIYEDTFIFLLDVFSFRLTEMMDDLLGMSGTFGFRIEMLYGKWGYLYDNGLLMFGNGFESINIIRYNDEDKLYSYLFGADNDIANFFVLFGIVGLALLFGLVFSFVWLAKSRLKYAESIEKYNVLLALLIFNITILLLSLFSRSFSMPGNVVTVVLSWGLIINTISLSPQKDIRRKRPLIFG